MPDSENPPAEAVEVRRSNLDRIRVLIPFLDESAMRQMHQEGEEVPEVLEDAARLVYDVLHQKQSCSIDPAYAGPKKVADETDASMRRMPTRGTSNISANLAIANDVQLAANRNRSSTPVSTSMQRPSRIWPVREPDFQFRRSQEGAGLIEGRRIVGVRASPDPRRSDRAKSLLADIVAKIEELEALELRRRRKRGRRGRTRRRNGR